MYEAIIKIVPYFCSLLAEIRMCWLIVTKTLNMKFYQIGFRGAAVFWQDRRNKNRATVGVSHMLWKLIYK
jgi:hypothetical protein